MTPEFEAKKLTIADRAAKKRHILSLVCWHSTRLHFKNKPNVHTHEPSIRFRFQSPTTGNTGGY